MSTRSRDERGATLAIVGVVMTVIVVIAAFAVDLGMQRVVRRDMQALADVVALDMARRLDGTSTAVQLKPAMDAAKTASVARNGDTLGGGLDVKYRLGGLDANGTFSTSISPPTAVEVTAGAKIDFAFAPGSGAATRTAIATTEGSACFKVGSFALGLASNDSILEPILGNAAAARVLSYGGLATADVSLLGLAAELGAGSPESLLTAPNIAVGELLDASAALLTEEGGTANLELATALGQIKTDLGPLASENVDFGELLSLGQTNGSALDAQVNVLDLLTGGLIVANGVNGVSVPELNLDVLGTTLTAKLWITEAPRIACNNGIATTAQGYVELSGTINLSVLGVGVRLRNVALRVGLANASARLLGDETACTEDKLTVEVFDRTLANVRLKAIIQLVVLFVWADVGRIDTGAPPVEPGEPYDLPIPESYTDPVTTDSGTIGLNLTNASVDVLGLNVGALVGALAPLVNGVTTLLTGTLLPALGITTAGADLWALPEPTCESPALIG
jgi:uncharacterized membrane protein